MTREPGRASMLEQVAFMRFGYQPSIWDAVATSEVAPYTPISRRVIEQAAWDYYASTMPVELR